MNSQVDSRRYAHLVLGLCTAAVGIRVAAIVALRAWEEPNAIEHAAIAMNVVEGHSFAFGDFEYFGPTSVQSPTYPLVLAALFAIFGVGSAAAYTGAMLLNAVLGGVATAGVARMTREMGGRQSEALVAAGLFAFWPTQVYATTHAQAVALITACVAWMVALFLRSLRDGDARTWIAFSAVASVASLTEPAMLPITALSGLWMLLARGLPARVRLRNAAILTVTGVLVLGPWVVRNAMVHGAFVPGKSTFWVNVWKGANPYATGTDRIQMSEERRREISQHQYALGDRDLRGQDADHAHQYDALSEEQRKELSGKSEMQREKIFRRYALEWIRANPRRVVELSVARLRMTVWVDWDNPKSHNIVYLGSRAAILALAVPGLLLAALLGWRLLYPLALVGSCLALYTLTLTAARFAIPLETVQFAVGSATLTWLASRLLPPSARAHAGGRN